MRAQFPCICNKLRQAHVAQQLVDPGPVKRAAGVLVDHQFKVHGSELIYDVVFATLSVVVCSKSCLQNRLTASRRRLRDSKTQSPAACR
jgi:hypothetical protein